MIVKRNLLSVQNVFKKIAFKISFKDHIFCGWWQCYAWDFSVHPWWRHQMETFSALLAICAGNSPVAGEIPGQRPVTCGFDVSFDLCLNEPLSKQSWVWWFETPSRSLWLQCNDHCDHILFYTILLTQNINNHRRVTRRSADNPVFSSSRSKVFIFWSKLCQTL